MPLSFHLLGSLGIAKILSTSLALTSSRLPVAWSPDSRWICYTVVESREPGTAPPGWIFGPENAPSTGNATAPRPVDASPGRDSAAYRIWATQAAAPYASALIEDSEAPLGSPNWRPDGRALAYTRFVPLERDGGRIRGHFEVILKEGLDKRKVLHSEENLEIDEAGLSHFSEEVPAWNRDGSSLAVTRPGLTSSILILDPRTGVLTRSIENASSPAWSPNGSKLAFIRKTAASVGTASLVVVDTPYLRGMSKVRSLLTEEAILQAPIWAGDGQSILAVCWKARTSENGRNRPPVLRLERISSISGERMREWLLAEPLPHRNRVQAPGMPKFDRPPATDSLEAAPRNPEMAPSCSVDFHPDSEECFYTTDQFNQGSTVVCQNLRNEITHKRFPALDPSVEVGNLAISPDGRTLAIRFRSSPSGNGLSTPVLCDITTEGLTVPSADDRIRVEWLSRLLRMTQGLLEKSLSPPTVPGLGIAERPILLPYPGELTAAHPLAGRIRRISRVARSISERSPDSPGVEQDAATRSFLAQSAVYFEYLVGNQKNAETALNELETNSLTPSQRAGLLGLRAQILMSKGDDAGSKAIIDYLTEQEPSQIRTVQETPNGLQVDDVPNPRRLWGTFLARCQDDLKKTRAQQERAIQADEALGAPPRPGAFLDEPIRADGGVRLPFMPLDPDPRLFINPPLQERP